MIKYIAANILLSILVGGVLYYFVIYLDALLALVERVTV